MKFLKEAQIDYNAFPDYPGRQIIQFQVNQDNIFLVWKRTKMDAQNQYIECVDFEDAKYIWNDRNFLEKY